MKYDELNSFNPATCISGKVLRVGRITANIFRKYLKPFDITDSQLNILFILSKKGGLNQKQLSGFTKLEKSSLNRNLNRLIERKFISKKEFPILNTSEKGLAFVNEMIPIWQKAMDEIQALLGEEGESALTTVHTKLINKKET